MARKIVICVISALVVMICVLSLYNTYRVKTKMTDLLETASLSLQRNDMNQAGIAIRDVKAYWEENEWLLIVYIDQTHIDEMGDSIAKLEAYSYNHDQNELYAELKLAMNIMDHIWKSHLPTINNIL